MLTELEKVSMVDGHLFEKIAAIATQLRKTDRPFGGIQVDSLSGDRQAIVTITCSLLSLATSSSYPRDER